MVLVIRGVEIKKRWSARSMCLLNNLSSHSLHGCCGLAEKKNQDPYPPYHHNLEYLEEAVSRARLE